LLLCICIIELVGRESAAPPAFCIFSILPPIAKPLIEGFCHSGGSEESYLFNKF